MVLVIYQFCSYLLVFLHNYIVLLQSQLLYCSQLWRIQLRKDIFIFERVQRRATKYILNDYQLPYRAITSPTTHVYL